MNLDRNPVICKFEDFRKKDLFIDCVLVRSWSEPEIKCHRIVLSKYSTFFKNYFSEKTFDPGCVKVHIPFSPNDNSFQQIIDFMYINSIPISEKNAMNILSLSVLYGVTSLETMVKDIFKISDENVFIYLKTITDLNIPKEALIKFPDLEKNLERLINESVFLTDYVANNFSSFSLTKIFDSVNPRLLSMILKATDLTDERKAKIINDYVETKTVFSMLSESDLFYLTSVINWDAEDSYIYLTQNTCDWVIPSVSRRLYSKILTKRRESSHAFSSKVETLHSPNFQNWFSFAWLTVVADSLGQVETPQIELADFIGTLGNLVPFFNPVKYRLLCSVSSVPLNEKYYSDAFMFEDSDKYFLTKRDPRFRNIKKDNALFIGFNLNPNKHSLVPSCFRVNNIKVEFKDMERGKPISESQKLLYKKTERMKLMVADEKREKFIFDKLVELNTPFSCDDKLISLLCIKSYDAQERVNDGIDEAQYARCFRISRLYSYGTFDSE